MWIFTKYGFYSAVCAREGDGRHGRPVDTDRIMVRARLRGHLEALQHRFPDQFGNSKIVEFAGTDYAYRVFLDKALWSEVLVGLSEDLDYDNFKSEVARFQGRDDAGYEHALHDVWSIMYELQRSD